MSGSSESTSVEISIHAPLAGSDFQFTTNCGVEQRISIHAPLAGSDQAAEDVAAVDVISIHAPLAGSDSRAILFASASLTISIHAPLAGSDLANLVVCPYPLISIHAPLAGSDGGIYMPMTDKKRFQSTLPSRGATHAGDPRRRPGRHFNPRSPRGERQQKCTKIVRQIVHSCDKSSAEREHINKIRMKKVLKTAYSGRSAYANRAGVL